jgi:MFS family permease
MQGFSSDTSIILLAVLNMSVLPFPSLSLSLSLSNIFSIMKPSSSADNISNRGSCFGRFFAGAIADHYGRLNTQTVLIALGATAIFTIWLPFGSSLAGLYLFSALFGLASGSFVSLAPVCIGQISKASEIGMRFGTCYSLVSFAYVHLAFLFLTFFFLFFSFLSFFPQSILGLCVNSSQ